MGTLFAGVEAADAVEAVATGASEATAVAEEGTYNVANQLKYLDEIADAEGQAH